MATPFILTRTKRVILGTGGANIELRNGDKFSQITYWNVNIIPPDSPNLLYSTIKLTHCELPYSFYGIDETNNRITINGNNIDVPIGFYTAYTLRDYINNANAISTTLLVLNTSTGKYTMENTNSFTITGSILPAMGLDAGTYTSIWNGSTFVIEFPKAINLIRTRCLYINFPNLVLDSLDTRTGNTSCLKSIQVNQPPFSIINYQNNESGDMLINNFSVKNLQLEIRGDDGDFINFQGQPWSISLEIKTVWSMAKIHMPQSFTGPMPILENEGEDGEA